MSTDSEIIARSIEDPGAFSEIFERHARAIASFAARRVGDAGDDVLSETFLVAFRRRAAFDTSWESSLPWLLGIASRLVRKQRAAEARQWRSLNAVAGWEQHVQFGEAEAAGERVDAAVEARALGGRIAALSAADRETLLLYAWADLTYEEIAVALRIPVGTVRSRLNRVRRKLDPARGKRGVTGPEQEKGDRDGRVAARA
ncbi:RNA polymerase sigma factor [Microbacterium sp. NPDC089321]|uniref:RNA polymerase sigma factor n=1 Tax=Microbacterium sp. NPDC089321 TaxID=3155183 RepID=UPI003412D35E